MLLRYKDDKLNSCVLYPLFLFLAKIAPEKMIQKVSTTFEY